MTIYQLSAEERDLLDLYSEIDRGSGEAFEDENCSVLVADWREIVEAEIARAKVRGEI